MSTNLSGLTKIHIFHVLASFSILGEYKFPVLCVSIQISYSQPANVVSARSMLQDEIRGKHHDKWVERQDTVVHFIIVFILIISIIRHGVKGWIFKLSVDKPKNEVSSTSHSRPARQWHNAKLGEQISKMIKRPQCWTSMVPLVWTTDKKATSSRLS